MASINDTAATSALNEDKYINKLYDNVIDKQKDLLKENYTTAGTSLDSEKQSVQQQTNTNLGRVNAEAQKIKEAYKGQKLSAGAQQQAALAMDNQQKKNVTTMKTVQSEADAEIERQRKLLGEQYAAAIKKAQADNDMARAQQLYEAAKAEEEQLRSLRQSAAALMATKGDNSISDSIARGDAVERDTTSETWDGVLKNEESINKIYDSAMESDKQAEQMVLNEALSKIEAEQAAETAKTDKNLTQTYVNALKNAKNYDEVQGAYGLGSGTLAQARLARALGLTGELTDQRGVQMGNEAKRGQKRYTAGQDYRDAIAKSLENNENKRAQELYKAAEEEEQKLVADQQLVGNQYAKNGDYTMLARLYGLTPEQISRLLGYSGSGGGGGGGGYRYTRGGDDDTGGGGTSRPVNMTIATNVGPYSDKTIANMVQSGQVNYNPVTKVYTKNESYGHIPAYTAMVNSQKAQAAGTAVMANPPKTSSSSGGGVSKFVNAVKNFFNKK